MNAMQRAVQQLRITPPSLPMRLRTLAAVALWACLPTTGRAYSTPDAYAAAPVTGGGGGRWFTGSPAEGLGCAVCHTAAANQRHFPLYAAGLPLGGYSLATPREIVLSWPQFAARWRELRPDATVAIKPDAPSPAVGLVAEFVAESGKGSGTIEIDASGADPGELCEMTRPNLQPRLGVKLYQVRSGIAPLQVKPDSTGLLHCESRQLGQRCIIALLSCGANQLRVRWTSPPSWEGPIWFSAGFVATEALSGTFEGDSVQEISVPIVQADTASGKYQQVLQSGCSLAPEQPTKRSFVLLGVLGMVAACLVRRRAARVGGERTRGCR